MNTYKKITSFFLILIMLLSLASCKGGEKDETTDPPSGENSSAEITEDTGSVTDEEKIPTALELFIQADKLAESYTSAVQTVTNKMTISGNPVATQITVNKKNGNNASYTVTSDGYTSDCVVLENGTISYFSDISGAFKLTDANFDDFESIVSGADSEMFDFSNTEYFTDGTVTPTENGYDATVNISETGKEMLAKAMGMNSGEYSFGNIALSGKIDKDGNCTEQRILMEITMTVQGMKMTLKSDAEMVFSEIGADVQIDKPLTDTKYLEFGKADQFISLLSAISTHESVTSTEIPFEYDRSISVKLIPSGSTEALYTGMKISAAYDPSLGMNYSAEQVGTDVAIKYYSDFTKTVVEEGVKKHVDPSIPAESVLYTILTDIDGNNFGLSSYSSVNFAYEKEFVFAIADDVADVAVNSYIANYMSYTVTSVRTKKAEQTFKLTDNGEFAVISLYIEATVTVNNVDCNVEIYDSVTVKSYNSATIVPIEATN